MNTKFILRAALGLIAASSVAIQTPRPAQAQTGLLLGMMVGAGLGFAAGGNKGAGIGAGSGLAMGYMMQAPQAAMAPPQAYYPAQPQMPMQGQTTMPSGGTAVMPQGVAYAPGMPVYVQVPVMPAYAAPGYAMPNGLMPAAGMAPQSVYSNYSGLTPQLAARSSVSECRKVTNRMTIDGYEQVTQGTACLQPDGSWRLMQ